jgi:hypothetical protein
MPFEEYLTEQDVKSIIPEISKFLWDSEQDFTPQKNQAVAEVKNEIISQGFIPAEIMPRLYLHNSPIAQSLNHITEPTEEDQFARLRFVMNISAVTGITEKIFFLQGSNDLSKWENISDFKINSAGMVTFIVQKSFLHYRLKAEINDGSLLYEAFMADTSIERLILLKWIELILIDRIASENDHYHLKLNYFKNEYQNLLSKIRIRLKTDFLSSSDDYSKLRNIKIIK